ncbi:MAG: hypothetical protein KA928_03330 [Longilinea sp.]|nr:hypothetical protein [Longilinea sp.]
MGVKIFSAIALALYDTKSTWRDIKFGKAILYLVFAQIETISIQKRPKAG